MQIIRLSFMKECNISFIKCFDEEEGNKWLRPLI
jgi:hypothetical protein